MEQEHLPPRSSDAVSTAGAPIPKCRGPKRPSRSWLPLAILALVVGCQPNPEAIRTRADALGTQHGILVGYGPPTSFFVPPYTEVDADTGGKIVQVELHAVPAALDGIEESLAVYPPGFIAQLCRAIFISGPLTDDGERAGGTYGRAWLVLVASSDSSQRSIFVNVRNGVHHEFSSLIWRKIPLLPSRWAETLPTNWTPARNNEEAIRMGHAGGKIDVRGGFVSRYGRSSAENDFHTYAQTAFLDPERLVSLADQHPLVAHKLALLIAASIQVDPRMREVFASLGLDKFRSTDPELLHATFHMKPAEIPAGEVVRP